MERMSLDTAIRLSAEVKGGANITKVQRSLQDLAKGSQTTARDMDALRTATAQYARASEGSIAGIRNSIVAFRGLQEQARIGGVQFRRYGDEVARLEARLKSLDQTSNRTALVAGLAGGVAGAIAVQAANVAGQSARGIVTVGLDAESARVRLRALSNEFGEYNKAQAASARIAQTLRLSTIEAEDAFSGLYASLRPTGVTVEEIEKAFIGFTAAARNSGATAAESAAAMVQLRQALSSGILQGEELRSIREQAPLVAQAIAQEMGVTIGKLKELGAEGKITTDVVLRALARLNETQLDKLNEQFNTGRQAIKDFQNEASVLGTEIARIFGPSAVSLLRTFTGALRDAANVMGALTGNAQSLENIKIEQRASDQAGAEANQKFGLFTFNQGGKSAFFQNRRRQIMQQMRQERAAALPAPGQLTPAQIAAQQAAATQRAQQAAAAAGAGGAGSKAAKAKVEVVIGGLTGGGQADASRGRSTGPHLHAQRVSGRGVNEQIAAALEFPGGKTALNYGERRRPGYHDGHAGNDYGTPQGTPFRLRPGWQATDMGVKGALGRGMRVSGPLGTFELGHLAGVKKGSQAEADRFEAAEDAAKKAAEEAKAREDGLRSSSRSAAIAKMNLDLSRATTEEAKLQANSDRERAERMYKFSAQLAEAKSTEEQINLMKQQGLEIQSAQVDMDREQLEYGKKLNDALLQRVGLSGELLDQSRFTGTGAGAKVQTFDLKGTLADTSAAEDKVSRLEQAAESSSQAIGGLFRDIISGTATAEESLSRMFQSIADSFASMVSDMIAEWAKAQIIGLFTKAVNPVVGGGGGFGPTSGDLFGQGLGVKGSLLGFAGGGYTGSSPRAGGIDGQGGFPAILHPQETVIDHTRMMPVPYQKGAGAAATSEQIVPYQASTAAAATGQPTVPYQSSSAAASNGLMVPFQSGGTALAVPFLKGGGTGDGAASMPMDNEPIRYESTVINGVEFVTKAQAEEIGRRSEQRTFKRLQNSPSTRRAAGIR
jgi:tape measure domain-containing protein